MPTPKPRQRDCPAKRSAVYLRRDDFDALVAITESHGISRPTVVRIGLARLAAEPPTKAELIEPTKPTCYRNGKVDLRRNDLARLAGFAEAHNLDRVTVVRISLARLAAEPPTAAEIAETQLDRTPLPREADPDPETIEAIKAEIQAEWSDDDRLARQHPRNKTGKGRRRKRKSARWSVPTVRTPAGLHLD